MVPIDLKIFVFVCLFSVIPALFHFPDIIEKHYNKELDHWLNSSPAYRLFDFCNGQNPEDEDDNKNQT